MTDEALHPVGPELGRKNRRLFAKHEQWPDGALENCEKLDDEYPAWSFSYCNGDMISWSEAGYYAIPRNRHFTEPKWVYGATADDVRTKVETTPLRD